MLNHFFNGSKGPAAPIRWFNQPSRRRALSWLLLLLWLAGCKTEPADPRLPAPNIGHIPSELTVVRADQWLKAQTEEEFRSTWEKAYAEHDNFSVFYRDWILQFEERQLGPDQDQAGWIYQTFVAPEMMRELADTLDERLSDLSGAFEVLDLAYRYHRYYFPQDTLPPLYTYSGVFGQPVDLSPDFAALALTMFLGRDFSGYRNFPSENLPRFLFHRLSPEYIPVRVMDAIGRTRWAAELPENTVLQHMLYEGKLLCYLDRVMPDVPDSVKIGFTHQQLQWVRQNQGEAWTLMVAEELLFSTKSSDIARLVGEGPHTKGMSLESPSRVGVWLGWQMARAYLERYPNTSLDELFAMTDARALLEASKWKPKSY